MPTDATSGFGATLSYTAVASDYSSAVYTKLSQITDMPMPSIKTGKDEISNQDSPVLPSGTPVKEYMATWADAGSIQSEQIYTKASLTTLYTINGVTQHWKILLADGSDIQFDGFVDEISATSKMEKAIRVSVGICLANAPVFTAAT